MDPGQHEHWANSNFMKGNKENCRDLKWVDMYKMETN